MLESLSPIYRSGGSRRRCYIGSCRSGRSPKKIQYINNSGVNSCNISSTRDRISLRSCPVKYLRGHGIKDHRSLLGSSAALRSCCGSNSLNLNSLLHPSIDKSNGRHRGRKCNLHARFSSSDNSLTLSTSQPRKTCLSILYNRCEKRHVN